MTRANLTWSRRGIYYVTRRWRLRLHWLEYQIRFLDFASGRSEVLFTREGLWRSHRIEVSPDERWLLFSPTTTSESELRLAERFR